MGVLVLKGLVSLHRTIQLQIFSITSRGIGLDYRDIEWFALETNRNHSVIFEIATKYCISYSFVDYEGYSISSKGFSGAEGHTLIFSYESSKIAALC